ncbi:MAG: hypothetical protein H7831_08375 [Magnetococcus sp. WYHC-3]
MTSFETILFTGVCCCAGVIVILLFSLLPTKKEVVVSKQSTDNISYAPTKADRVTAAWVIYRDNLDILNAMPDSPTKHALLDREINKRDALIEQALDVP